MFGIGAQEMLLIGLLCLLVFGPGKLTDVARDLGGFVRKARESVEEFGSEFVRDGRQNDHRKRGKDSLYGGWDPEDREFAASEKLPGSRTTESSVGTKILAGIPAEAPWPEYDGMGSTDDDEAAFEPARTKGQA